MVFWITSVALTLCSSAVDLTGVAGLRIGSSAPNEAEAEPRQVILAVPAGDPVFGPSAIEQELTPYLEGSQLNLELSHFATDELPVHIEWATEVSARADVRAVFWIEHIPTKGRRLYLMEPRSQRMWVRGLPEGSPNLIVDTVGALLHDLSLGLEAGEPPKGMVSVRIERSPLVAAQPEPQPRRLFPWLAVQYAGGSFDSQAPFQSGVGGAIGLTTSQGVVVSISGEWLAPSRRDTSPPLVVHRVPIDALVGFRFRRGKKLRPEVGAGLTFEPLWWEADDDEDVEGDSGSALRVAVTPFAGLSWRFWRGLGIHLRLGARIWVSNVDLAVELRQGRVDRVSPHVASGLVQAGVHYRF